MRIDLHVRERRNATLVVAALAHLFPVFRDLEEEPQIQPGIVAAFLKCRNDHLDCGMRVAERERSTCSISDSSACFSGFDDVSWCHAADIVAMHVNGQTDLGVECLHDTLGTIRREHARHVFDGDGIGTQIFELLTVFKEAIERMNRRYRVRDRAFEVGSALLDGFGVIHHIADIVQRVEHAEDIDAISVCCLDETKADLAGIMLVAHKVLSTREHG